MKREVSLQNNKKQMREYENEKGLNWFGEEEKNWKQYLTRCRGAKE